MRRAVWNAGFTILATWAAIIPSALVPSSEVMESYLLFDGVCNLCDGFINFVADHDSDRNVKFGAQQKHQELLTRIGAPTDLSTVVLIQGDRFYTHSSAALRTVALMDWPWRALATFYIVPAPVRDYAYRLVAKHRYSVFGKAESCRAPSGGVRPPALRRHPLAPSALATSSSPAAPPHEALGTSLTAAALHVHVRLVCSRSQTSDGDSSTTRRTRTTRSTRSRPARSREPKWNTLLRVVRGRPV